MRHSLLTLFALSGLDAMADDRSFAFGAAGAVSSMVIDRGEQLADAAFESEIVVEWAGETDAFYAGIYRLSPFGSHGSAFPEEVDYFAGYTRSGEGYTMDVSAAWLSYPGEPSEDNSLELAGYLSLDELPFQPDIAGFYDAEFEDWGLEVTAGPNFNIQDWSTYARLRLGFVSPGDGSETRNYIGFQAGGAYPVSDNIEFEAFVRGEKSDQDSFADTYIGQQVDQMRDSGLAIGVSLSFVG